MTLEENEHEYYTESAADVRERVQEWSTARVAQLPYHPSNPFWHMSDSLASTLLLEALEVINGLTGVRTGDE